MIAVGSRASNDWASVRPPYAVDTMHFDPFAHDRSQRAAPDDLADAGSLRSAHSQRTIVNLAVLAAHPDTLDALHSANNAVAVIVAASAATAVDSNCRKPVAASSCPVAWEIAFSVVPVAGTVTCAGDKRPQRPLIVVFAIVAGLVAPIADDRSPLRPPMDTVMPVHCSVLPIRPDRPDHLIRQHADRPCRTYYRLAIGTLDTAIAVEIAVAMDVELDGGHMRRAVPLDAPPLQSHHIDNMHLCLRKPKESNCNFRAGRNSNFNSPLMVSVKHVLRISIHLD